MFACIVSIIVEIRGKHVTTGYIPKKIANPWQASATTKPYPKQRNLILDILREGKRKHTIYGLFEVELTSIRQHIKQLKQTHHADVPLLAYLVKGFAEVIENNKHVNAYRYKRKGKLILFDDVDVSVMVEKKIAGEAMPVGYIVRKSNEKSVFEIANEIKKAKESPVEYNGYLTRGGQLFFSLPGFLRKLVWFFIRSNPYLFKSVLGTSIATRMNDTAFGIPLSPMTLTLFIGGIFKKVCIENNESIEKSFVQITLCSDHDIVDGMQLKRFASSLKYHLHRGIHSPQTTPAARKFEGIAP